MKILCIIPPYIPSYFNAGHHLPIFLVASFLRKRFPSYAIETLDCAALNCTWKEICDLLNKQYDVIVMLNDFDTVDTFQRFMYYKSMLSSHSKVITFGRLSKQIPRFFFQFNIDAVHYHGDYEIGIYHYIRHLSHFNDSIPGVLLSPEDSPIPGESLDPNAWVMPDVTEIPYKAYSNMYKNDLNKFCGIPNRQELVVPIARGCPVGCAFCDVPFMQGRFERRMEVDDTIAYIQESFSKFPFEYVSFYAPTFTLNKKWVKSFCNKMKQLDRQYPWKCVTVLKLLNEELIKYMAESGCIRISLGIESFTNTASMKLPKLKQDTLNSFKQIAALCTKHHIELNCFIILGLPDDTPKDVAHTIAICLQLGARIRPTIYTPYEKMHEKMTLQEISQYNRQLFPPDYLSAKVASEYYEIFYNNKNDTPTKVMKNISVAS